MADNDPFTQFNFAAQFATAEEANLFKAARAGDIKAFNTLFLEYAPRIYRYLAFFLISPLIAEELTSQVFVRVWQNLTFYNQDEISFFNWLFEQADHFITQKNVSRLKNNHNVGIPNEPSFLLQPQNKNKEKTGVYFPQSDCRALSRQLYKLPKYNRLVLYLYYFEFLNFDDISLRLRLTQPRVQKLYNEALRLLTRPCQTKAD